MNEGVLLQLDSEGTEMQCYNPPSDWKIQDARISIIAGAKTDFWRKTHYGFVRDSGNFYYEQITGNFVADVKITGQYKTLYDQVGIMIRQDETTWLKCGIEFMDGVQQASVVVTRDYSDWSVVPLLQNPAACFLRVKRKAATVEVSYSLDGEHYTLLRLAYLTLAETLQVGVMCAAPQGEGFPVVFERFRCTVYSG